MPKGAPKTKKVTPPPTPAQLEARRKLLGMNMATTTRKNSPASSNNSGNNKNANASTKKAPNGAKPLTKMERAAKAAAARAAANLAKAKADRAAGQAASAAAAPHVQAAANAAIARNQAERNAATAEARRREEIEKEAHKAFLKGYAANKANAANPHSHRQRQEDLAVAAGNIRKKKTKSKK